MKAYTDLEQSKKLSEILPLESADMCYGYIAPYLSSDGMYKGGYDDVPYPKDFLKGNPNFSEDEYDGILPCWSIAVLLGVIPKIINHETLFIETSPALWHVGYRNIYIARADNLVDACCELILKLNELKML